VLFLHLDPDPTTQINADPDPKPLFPTYAIFVQANGEPLFSSHMLDLSEEFDEENIATCAKYFKRMTAVKLWLEMEIGITGGEEDGVDNTGVKADALYTKPEQVRYKKHVFLFFHQCCGSGMFIPDHYFSVPDLGSKVKKGT
jgi:fructose/tagatose bisphosphate aldolase